MMVKWCCMMYVGCGFEGEKLGLLEMRGQVESIMHVSFVKKTKIDL